ncbi:MAG: helix-turn-helix domain-containing protein [bacterium]
MANSTFTENESQDVVGIANPIWLTVSEAAKIGGVASKTIRRAIADKAIKYKLIKERYLIELESLGIYLASNTKLYNKYNQFGLGQYRNKWLNQDDSGK